MQIEMPDGSIFRSLTLSSPRVLRFGPSVGGAFHKLPPTKGQTMPAQTLAQRRRLQTGGADTMTASDLHTFVVELLDTLGETIRVPQFKTIDAARQWLDSVAGILSAEDAEDESITGPTSDPMDVAPGGLVPAQAMSRRLGRTFPPGSRFRSYATCIVGEIPTRGGVRFERFARK